MCHCFLRHVESHFAEPPYCPSSPASPAPECATALLFLEQCLDMFQVDILDCITPGTALRRCLLPLHQRVTCCGKGYYFLWDYWVCGASSNYTDSKGSKSNHCELRALNFSVQHIWRAFIYIYGSNATSPCWTLHALNSVNIGWQTSNNRSYVDSVLVSS